MKKTLKWLIPVIAAVGLAVAAILILPGLLKGNKAPEQTMKVYWNVERLQYVGTDRMRMKRNGYYHATFATEGKQVDMLFEKQGMMEYADSLEFMGLVADEENVVSQVVDVSEFTGGVGAYKLYVDTVSDTELVLNTAESLRGMPMTLALNENSKFYFVDPDGGPLVGTETKIKTGGTISAIMDKQGFVMCAFYEPPFEPSPVYYNVERMWDKDIGLSTRQPDLTGVYTILFSVDGEQVELKCRDEALVNKIDEFATRVMALEFDENGYITGVSGAWNATGGWSQISWFYVTAIEGRNITCVKSLKNPGDPVTGVLANNYAVYDVSSAATVIGEKTDLRVGDLIHCLTNKAGDQSVIYVVGGRAIDLPIYWKVERMWDKDKKASTRTVSADGYYHFTMSVDGKQVDVKTSDKKTVDTIDGRAVACIGLRVSEDGTILRYEMPWLCAATKGGDFASYYYVKSISGNTITVEKKENGKVTDTKTGKLASGYKVFDVTPVAKQIGEKTTLRTGDLIHALADPNGDAIIIYIVGGRAVDLPIYWNVDRMWDKEKQVSTRTVSADGYYHFTMSLNGKWVDLKTKDKETVNTIDGRAVDCIGLEVSGDLIKKAEMPWKCQQTIGGDFLSGYKVTAINGNTITASKGKENGAGKMAANCQVFNVSTAAIQEGEVTKLQVGDTIHGLADKDGNARIIYVISRPWDLPIYWNVERKWDAEKKASTRTVSADGCYHFTMSVDGKQVDLKTKDKTIVDTIDGRAVATIGLQVNGDEITRAVMPWYCTKTSGGDFASYYYVKSIAKDGSVTLEKRENGKVTDTKTGKLTASPIYDVSTAATVIGEKTELRVGDLVHCLADGKGDPALTYVVGGRAVDMPIYWNVEKKYDSTNKTTTRTPDADGYYHLTVAVDGKQVELKTKDKATVDAIDGRTVPTIGLTVKDGEILKYEMPWKVERTKGGDFASYYYVTAISGDTVTAEKREGGKVTDTKTGKMTADCGVFDVTNAADMIGETTDLRVGDLIHALADGNGDAAIIYVVGGRTLNMEIYWNVEKQYDSTNKTTTRTPDADGYYHLTMAVNGEQVELKTKDKATVDAIDGRAVPTIGLTVKNGEIKNYEMPWKVEKTKGGDFASWYDVVALGDDGTVTALKVANGSDQGTLVTGKLPAADQIFDVSSTAGTVGEVTTVQLGDRIHGLAAADGTPVILYVISRNGGITAHGSDHCVCGGIGSVGDHTQCTDAKWLPVASVNYWNVLTKAGTLSGRRAFKDTETYIYLTADITLDARLEVDPGQTVNICLNGHTLTTKSGERFAENCGGTLNLCDCQSTGKLVANNFPTAIYNYAKANFNLFGGTVTTNLTTTTQKWGLLYGGDDKVDSLNLTTAPSNIAIYGGTVDASGLTMTASGSHGGALWQFCGGKVAIYDGTLKGANITDGNGGAISVTSGSAKFLMTGGTVTGGKAPLGGNIYLAGADSTISGGTVTGGSTGVYLKAGATLSGTVSITENTDGNLYLASGAKIKVDGLASDAKVGITMAQPGVFADTTKEALKDQITSDDNDYTVQYDNGTLLLGIDPSLLHTHCLCSDKLEENAKTQHGTCKSVTWTGVSSLEDWNALTEAGALSGRKRFKDTEVSIYLTADITLDARLEIDPGQTVNICLNGFTLTTKASDRFVEICGGTLNLTDCETTGKLAANNCNVAISLYAGAKFNLYGGTVTTTLKSTTQKWGLVYGGNDAISSLKLTAAASDIAVYGGVIDASGMTMTASGSHGGAIWSFYTGNTVAIHGGTVKGANITAADGNGGAISVTSGSAKFTMTGGTVTGGKAPLGGNIYLAGADSTLSGGTVTGGSTGVYLKAGATLSGTVNITENTDGNLCLASGAKIKVDGLASDAKIGITMEEPGVFAETAKGELLAVFTGDSAEAAYEDGKLFLVKGHTHCLCGGDLEENAKTRHGKCTDVTWTKVSSLADWNDLTEAGAMSGRKRFKGTTASVFLTADITLDARLEVDPGQTVNICLNGHTLTTKSGERFTEICGGTLNLCDCQGTGKLVANNFPTAIYNYAKANFNLYGGTVTTNLTTTTQKWGVIYGGNDAVSSLSLTTAVSNIAIYGGTVDASGLTMTASGAQGGAIWLFCGGKLEIHGGTVKGGSLTASDSKGGSISITSGSAKFTMTGGTITGGKSGNAGNVYLASGAKMEMSGGTITGGTAASYGGNIFATSTKNSDNVWVGSNLTMTGESKLEKGSAKEGGNIYVAANSVLTMQDNALISDGTATENGGNVRQAWQNATSRGTLLMSGNAKLEGGKAGKLGGSVYMGGGVTTLSGNASIVGSSQHPVTAPTGGCVYVTGSPAVLTLNDSSVISGGTATNGGCVYAQNGNTVLNGGTITGGTASKGANIYVCAAATVKKASAFTLDGTPYLETDAKIQTIS